MMMKMNTFLKKIAYYTESVKTGVDKFVYVIHFNFVQISLLPDYIIIKNGPDIGHYINHLIFL